MQTQAVLLFGAILLTAGCKVQDASSFANESTAAASEPKEELATQAEIDLRYQGAWYATGVSRGQYAEVMPIWPPEYTGGATATSIAIHKSGFVPVRLIHPTESGSLAILLDNRTSVALTPVPFDPGLVLVQYYMTWRVDLPESFRMIVEVRK